MKAVVLISLNLRTNKTINKYYTFDQEVEIWSFSSDDCPMKILDTLDNVVKISTLTMVIKVGKKDALSSDVISKNCKLAVILSMSVITSAMS